MEVLLLALLAFGIILVPLVIIHEFGHLVACKIVGITVLEFGIGFPPRLAKLFRWGETEFTLNVLPLGGFVMPYGEDIIKPQTEEELNKARTAIAERGLTNPKSVFEARPYQKMWFLFAGPLANFLAALVLFTGVALTGLQTPFSDVTIAEIFSGGSAAQSDLRPGDVITHVNGSAIETSLDLQPLLDNPKPISLTVRRGSENVMVSLLPGAHPELLPQERVYVGAVEKDSPAQVAGLQAGDMFLVVNGEAVTSAAQVQKITGASENQLMQVTVQRTGTERKLEVTPRRLNNEARARIGIQLAIQPIFQSFGFMVADANVREKVIPYSPLRSVKYAANSFTRAIQIIVSIPGKLFRHEVTLQEVRPVSPVGISQIGGEMIKNYPYQDVIIFVALISIALGVTNLLPIPGLDGGRMLFVLIEIIRGKPMTPEREGIVHLIGIGLMFSLLIVLVINDILNPLKFPLQ